MWENTTYIGTKSGDYYYRFQRNLNMTLEIGFCIPAPQIEALVEERLLEKIRSYDLGSFEEELRSRQTQRKKRIKAIDVRLSSIEEEISNSAESLVKTNLKILIDKINEKVAKLQKEIEDLNTERVNILEQIEEDLHIPVADLVKVQNIFKNKPANIKQAILEFLLSKVVVDLISNRFVKICLIWKMPEWGVDELCLDRGRVGTHWTQKEIHILKELYPSCDLEHILEALPDRTWFSIRRRASMIGIHADRIRGNNGVDPDLSWNDRRILQTDIQVGKWRLKS
jgi:hypothetical protein